MGLIIKRELISGGVLGVWEIGDNEQKAGSVEKLQLNEQERLELTLIRNEKRKLQWKGVRLLINCLTGSKQIIVYDKYGKPSLKDSDLQLSISHAAELIAVIIAKKAAGIDIEKRSERVMKISHRFMSTFEFEQIEEDKSLQYLHVYWGAKEALYKLYGKKSLVFKKHLQIAPFRFSENGGVINGRIKTDHFDEQFLLRYEILNDYTLVYVPE